MSELRRYFPDDVSCARLLESLKWPYGFLCPFCDEESEPYRFHERPLVLRCRRCRRETSLLSDTLFARTRVPLPLWFEGAFVAVASAGGASPSNLQRALGLGRFETAYLMSQRLRAAMHGAVSEPLGERGDVGAFLVEYRRGVIVALFESEDAVRVRVVRDTVEAELVRYVDLDAMVLVPRGAGGKSLGAVASDAGFDVALWDGPVGTMGERLGARLVEWLGRHGSGATKQLQGELNEFSFRARFAESPAEGFDELLRSAVVGEAPTAEDVYEGRWVHPNPGGGLLPL